MRLRILAFLLAVCGLVSCSSEPAGGSGPGAAAAPPRNALPDDRPVITAFGDSLSEGYGVEEGEGYPDQLQRALDEAGYRYRVVNAGISGDTTSGGVTRISAVLAAKPAIVILELGGNDGLRGLPIETTRANLEEIIVELKKAPTTVVLAGMTLPPNYGPDYISGFEQVFEDLATKYDLPLIPFLLEGVGGHQDLMQRDGIHPNAEGHRIVAQNVMEVIAPLLEK
ncbi:MAG: arylesterase [bacterium]|nr:arylesterase [bacterium]